MLSMRTTIDLFAGAGGASTGLRNAGFHHELCVEWDKDAASTLVAAGPRPVAWPQKTHCSPDKVNQQAMFGPLMKPWVSIGTALGIDTTIIGGGTNPREPEGKRTYRDITDEPSTTVAAVQIGNAGPFIVDEETRRLTWRECAVLQGFPDDHPFQGKTQASFYKQVGNAVCPIVSEVLGRCVLQTMDS